MQHDATINIVGQPCGQPEYDRAPSQQQHGTTDESMSWGQPDLRWVWHVSMRSQPHMADADILTVRVCSMDCIPQQSQRRRAPHRHQLGPLPASNNGLLILQLQASCSTSKITPRHEANSAPSLHTTGYSLQPCKLTLGPRWAWVCLTDVWLTSVCPWILHCAPDISCEIEAC